MMKTITKITTIHNFELDYTFLLEVSIKGNVLSFTDDKAKRYEINKCLGRIATTAAAAYGKITGREKEQQYKNIKKEIHLFEDQLKSWHLDITNNHDHKLQPAVD